MLLLFIGWFVFIRWLVRRQEEGAPAAVASAAAVPAMVCRDPRQRVITLPTSMTMQEFSAPTSAIYLLVTFQVFDREGHDSTEELFTPLLKELFLIIATYTIRNGAWHFF